VYNSGVPTNFQVATLLMLYTPPWRGCVVTINLLLLQLLLLPIMCHLLVGLYLVAGLYSVAKIISGISFRLWGGGGE